MSWSTSYRGSIDDLDTRTLATSPPREAIAEAHPEVDVVLDAVAVLAEAVTPDGHDVAFSISGSRWQDGDTPRASLSISVSTITPEA